MSSLIPTPQVVQNAINEFVGELAQYFGQNNLTYTVSCDVSAATSVANQLWSAGADPGQTTFVGSAVKTFILAQFLRSGPPEDQPLAINDGIRSVSSSVFGDQTLDGKPAPSVK